MSRRPAAPETREAIGRLFDEHADRIYRLGLHTCGSEDGAADLVQETFLRALRSWDGFEGRAQASTWLHTIATRACQRMERRRAGEPRRFASLDRDALAGAAPVATSDPFQDTARAEARERVRDALPNLEADFRLPLLLKELEGLSVREVSEILDVPVATVKTRLYRARLKLTQLLEAGAHDPEPGEGASSRCLDLLEARQRAEERGVPFPLPAATLCERCRATFEGLDLVSAACSALGRERLDDELLEKLRSRVLDS